MKKQRGSTIVGFIAGLVLGLGVALAVAVYVTKVPIPFLHQSPSRTADQDADEWRKNKDWDPNAPLYGKNPVRPALPASAPAQGEVPAAVAAASAPAPTKVPAATAPASAAKASHGDALGDLAKARAAAATDPMMYFVQAGAFRTAEDAEAQRVKLSLAGLEAKISERDQSGRNVFRVRVGPIDTREDADKTKERMDAAGFETALIRVQK
jgi:cell division protein FtsN